MNDIALITKLSKEDNKRLKLNDRFICETSDGSGMTFSDEVKEDNCNRYSRCADAIVYDDKSFGKRIGKICICRDVDLNDMLTMLLFLKDTEDAVSWNTSFSIQDFKIEDNRIQVRDFMKLIYDIPLYSIKEPYDACGLTVVQFTEHDKHFPNIEFGIDGRLYYEIVDETNYKEGDFIPLDSNMRKDVINYVKLTKENMQEIADKINASLKRLYQY